VTRNLLTSPMVDMDRQPHRRHPSRQQKESRRSTTPTRAMIQLLAIKPASRSSVPAAARRLEIVALRREMDLAKKVQEKLIPKSPPDVPGLEATGWTRAASVTGAIALTFGRMHDGVGDLLGDASGHGLAPALVVRLAGAHARAHRFRDRAGSGAIVDARQHAPRGGSGDGAVRHGVSSGFWIRRAR
jgi:hypothetical protein